MCDDIDASCPASPPDSARHSSERDPSVRGDSPRRSPLSRAGPPRRREGAAVRLLSYTRGGRPPPATMQWVWVVLVLRRSMYVQHIPSDGLTHRVRVKASVPTGPPTRNTARTLRATPPRLHSHSSRHTRNSTLSSSLTSSPNSLQPTLRTRSSPRLRLSSQGPSRDCPVLQHVHSRPVASPVILRASCTGDAGTTTLPFTVTSPQLHMAYFPLQVVFSTTRVSRTRSQSTRLIDNTGYRCRSSPCAISRQVNKFAYPTSTLPF